MDFADYTGAGTRGINPGLLTKQLVVLEMDGDRRLGECKLQPMKRSDGTTGIDWKARYGSEKGLEE